MVSEIKTLGSDSSESVYGIIGILGCWMLSPKLAKCSIVHAVQQLYRQPHSEFQTSFYYQQKCQTFQASSFKVQSRSGEVHIPPGQFSRNIRTDTLSNI